MKASASTVQVHGAVRGAKSGRVSVVVQRRSGGRWVTVRHFTSTVAARAATYARDVKGLAAGSYRVRASYLGASGARPSHSPYHRFRVTT